jgi:DNA helicase-2/ATP-dependent DNA helicase PcrA
MGIQLNDQQKKAIEFGEGPFLIVAGAGTGKTTVITQRLAWLIAQGKARSDEILALTFTEKAAGEMEERVDQLLPYGYLDLWVSTFHSFAERILKDNALEIGLPNDFKLFNEFEQWILIRQNLDRFKLDYYRPLGNSTKFIRALIKHFSRAKDEAISPEEYLEYAENLRLNTDSVGFLKDQLDPELIKKLTKKELREIAASEIKKTLEVAEAYHTYQQLLLEESGLDFGDLITYCLQLFRQRPLILTKYRSQFKYILVDEFQDTNWAQYELIKLMAAPKNNLTVVADDDQSIFRFRGASMSNILQFKKDYPASQEVILVENYRSAQPILNLAYHFIQLNNPNRLEYQLSQNNKSEKKIDKKLIAQQKQEAQIEVLRFSTQDDETKSVIRKIVELKEKDPATSWADFAILVRANDQASNFISVLELAQIPYQFLASRGLYNKSVVLDILAYLKLLDSYHESSALFRVLSLSTLSFSQEELVKLTYWAKRKACSLFEVLNQARLLGLQPELTKKIDQILTMIEKHSDLARRKSVTEMVLAFLEDSGYLKYLTKLEEIKSLEIIGYLNQFYKRLQKFEKAAVDRSLKSFLAEIELEIEAGEEGSLTPDLETGPETVKILTVHGAKGLEFKYVFLVNLVDRRFPTIERKEEIPLPDALVKEIVPEGDIHLEEERRLFYVAMTRAKIGLFFSWAQDYGGARKKKSSRFLQELGLVKPETKKKKEIKIEITEQVINQKKLTLPLLLPAKFSYTQLAAFNNCPYQYRYAHLLKVPVRGKGTFSFGKSMHLTLERFFELILAKRQDQQKDLFGQKELPIQVNLEELLDIYENSWQDDWYLDAKEKADYFTHGKKILREFYEKHQDNWPPVKFLEKEFNVKIQEGEKSYTLIGKIDRIDEVEGKLRLIDYKTGTPKEEDAMGLSDKDQLLIYQLAGEEIFSEPLEGLTFYYLDNNTEISFLGTEKNLIYIKNKIIKTISEIAKGEFPARPSRLCRFCDFREICEFKQL